MKKVGSQKFNVLMVGNLERIVSLLIIALEDQYRLSSFGTFDMALGYLNPKSQNVLVITYDRLKRSPGFQDILQDLLQIEKVYVIVVYMHEANVTELSNIFVTSHNLWLIRYDEGYEEMLHSCRQINKEIVRDVFLQSMVASKRIPLFGEDGAISFLPVNKVGFIKRIANTSLIREADAHQDLMSFKPFHFYNRLRYPNFYQLHHAYLVNIDQLEYITNDHGLYCQMKCGSKIPVMNRFSGILQRQL